MKNRVLIAMFLGILVLGLASTAAAVPYTWVDTINSGQLIGSGGSVTYTHDLNDNNFDPNRDLITSYSLNILLRDDGGRCDGWEVAFIDQPGLLGDGFYSFSYSNPYGWSIAGLLQLNTIGTLTITITSWSGDFYFDQSTLIANGQLNSSAAPVPEPSTLMLLGSGLSGLGVWQFFRRKPKR
jgi:hypothetical protein